jgi:homoserine kinase
VRASAFAPAGLGNVAVGFDLLGQALSGLGDTVHATRIDRGVQIDAIDGLDSLPRDAMLNTAGKAAHALLEHVGASFGVSLHIEKGIPLGSGLGGSAASAVAAVVAVNALLERPLATAELYPFALEGEAVASGAKHGDNVGPQLLGGLVLAFADRCISLPTPPNWWAVVVHPNMVLETRTARAVLQAPFELKAVLAQQSNLLDFVVSLERGDYARLRQVLRDELVEPRRQSLIPGFAEVKAAALAMGAVGSSISGAGPSVFAWFESEASARQASAPMQAAFAQAGLESQALLSPLNAPGARLLG